MSEIVYRAEVTELAVFSINNNSTPIGTPLENGAYLRRLPWAQNESLTVALDYWGSAEAAAGVLNSGTIGLAARIGGIWFHVDTNDLH